MVLELLLSLAWLAVVSFSIGFALTREKSIMTFGFGLAGLSVLFVIFNLAGIPLNWLLFLAISAAILAYFVYRKELTLELPGKPDTDLALVILFAAINFLVYLSGSNAYPYLEDDDPWVHAVGIKWVAETGSYSRYFDGANFYRLYIEPYPPAFDALLGTIHQMTPSVTDTMKFYNPLLIALSLVFAFYFFREATKNSRLSMLACFFLLCLPSFMGHFIWAQTLAVLLMLVAFYGFERIKGDERFVLPTGVAIGGIAVSQPSTAAIFVTLAAIYVAARFFAERRFSAVKPLLLCALIGLALAAVYYVPIFLKYGTGYALLGIGVIDNIFTGKIEDTSGGVIYSLADYLFVQPQGKIDQHIGVGLALAALSIAGLALCLKERSSWKKEAWLVLFSAWLVFTFIGTEGNALPLKLFPHRFWVFLSIPVAVLSAYAYLKLEERTSHRTALLVVLIAAVLFTAADPKLKVQTSVWPPGVSFTSMEELSGYLAMKGGVPKNTLVFPLCSDDQKVIGSDMLSEPYDKDYEAFKRDALNRSADEVYSFLKPRGYRYLIIDSTCVSKLGAERTAQMAAGYESGAFQPVYFNGGFALLELK